jgi:hypothetical protein
MLPYVRKALRRYCVDGAIALSLRSRRPAEWQRSSDAATDHPAGNRHPGTFRGDGSGRFVPELHIELVLLDRTSVECSSTQPGSEFVVYDCEGRIKADRLRACEGEPYRAPRSRHAGARVRRVALPRHCHAVRRRVWPMEAE